MYFDECFLNKSGILYLLLLLLHTNLRIHTNRLHLLNQENQIQDEV